MVNSCESLCNSYCPKRPSPPPTSIDLSVLISYSLMHTNVCRRFYVNRHCRLVFTSFHQFRTDSIAVQLLVVLSYGRWAAFISGNRVSRNKRNNVHEETYPNYQLYRTLRQLCIEYLQRPPVVLSFFWSSDLLSCS